MYNEVKHWMILGLLAIPLFGVTVLNAYTQEPYSIGEKNSSHFIRRWLALGPFIEGEPAQKAIEVDYILLATGTPESQFATLEAAPKAWDSVALTLEGYATQEQIWKVLELPEDMNVNKMLVEEGDINWAVAYLLTFIESKEPKRRELMIGFDDAVKVWLNGEVVHTSAVVKSLTPDEDKVFVNLKEGINCLMLKVVEATVNWRLTVRFADESGLQFFDTPNRRLLPFGKRLIRLPNHRLKTPESKTGKGTDIQGISYRHCRLLQRADGYSYEQGGTALPSR